MLSEFHPPSGVIPDGVDHLAVIGLSSIMNPFLISKAVFAQGKNKADVIEDPQGTQSRRLTLQSASRRTGLPFDLSSDDLPCSSDQYDILPKYFYFCMTAVSAAFSASSRKQAGMDRIHVRTCGKMEGNRVEEGGGKRRNL